MSVHPGKPRKRGGRRPSVVRWRDERGRNRQRTFDRRQDAVAFDAELVRRRQAGPGAIAQLTGEGTTLEEWRQERWRPEHAASLEESTLATYDEVWERHVLAQLGGVVLTRVTASTIRSWQSELVARGTPVDTIRKARTVLSSVLRHAAESDAIPANPVSVVRAPRRTAPTAVRPVELLEAERIRLELLHLAPAAPGSYRHTEALRDVVMVSLMAYAGLRPGEVRALRWNAIREATIVVDQAVSAAGKVKATKTTSIGTVRLLGPLREDLEQLRAAAAPRPTGLVIGELWSKDTWELWRSRRWRRAVKRAGVEPRPRPYDLRHTFASGLLAEGRSVHYVATQMRHSPALTLQVYGHLFDEYRDREAIQLDAEVARIRKELQP